MRLPALWNDFLDTTPRQWGRRILALTGTVALPSLGHTAIAVSVGLHLFALHLLNQQENLPGMASDGSTVFEVEIRPSQPESEIEMAPVYDDSSGIFIKAQTPRSPAERRLDKYRRFHIAKDRFFKQPAGAPRREPYTMASLSPRHFNVIEHLQSSDQRDLPAPSATLKKDELNQHLLRYQPRFQSCYENALLRDESLNGKVHFELKTDPQGTITKSSVHFDGVGLAGIRQELQNCLKTVIGEVHFPKNLLGASSRTVQFQAVLSL